MSTMAARIPLMIFRAGGLSLALPTASVSAVVPWRGLVQVPRPGEHILGVLAWQSGLAAVVDLAALLGREATPARLAIIAGLDDANVAFPVTRVDSMPSLVLDDFVHSGFCEAAVPGRYVRAVGFSRNRQVIVLNLFAIADRLHLNTTGASR